MTALAILTALWASLATAVALGQHFWIRNYQDDVLAELLRLQQYLREAEAAERRYRDELAKVKAELAYYRSRAGQDGERGAHAVDAVVAGEAEDEP
jgi:hypothetical protein